MCVEPETKVNIAQQSISENPFLPKKRRASMQQSIHIYNLVRVCVRLPVCYRNGGHTFWPIAIKFGIKLSLVTRQDTGGDIGYQTLTMCITDTRQKILSIMDRRHKYRTKWIITISIVDHGYHADIKIAYLEYQTLLLCIMNNRNKFWVIQL